MSSFSRNLRGWASKAIPSHKYSSLDHTQKEIRIALLLPSADPQAKVQLILKTVSLLRNPDYEALSYVWGDAKHKKKIIVDGQSMFVTVNLHAALHQFRSDAKGEIVRIWTDAVCINQTDNAEKSIQVALMDEVYSNAKNVRMWLGTHDITRSIGGTLELDRADWRFGWLSVILRDDFVENYLADGVEDYWVMLGREVNGHTFDRAMRGLGASAEIFLNPYWSRRWITQEILLANSVSMHCGPNRYCLDPGTKFGDLYEKVSKIAARLSVLVPVNLNADNWLTEDEQAALDKIDAPCKIIMRALAPLAAFNRPLLEDPLLLRKIRGLDCKDRRDCVYGVLGLLKKQMGSNLLVPNYDTPFTTVFADFCFKLMCESKSLAFLYEAYPIEGQWNPLLPSWVPDLRFRSPIRDRAERLRAETIADGAALRVQMRTNIRQEQTRSSEQIDELASLHGLYNASASTEFHLKLARPGVLCLRTIIVGLVTEALPYDSGLLDAHPDPQRPMESVVPMDWLDNYDSVRRVNNLVSTTEVLDEHLIRILCADTVPAHNGAPARRATLEDIRNYLKELSGPSLPQEERTSSQPPLHNDMHHYSFFSVEDGLSGISYSPNVERGDAVAIISSLNLPLIVREVEPSAEVDGNITLRIVGTCFLHGRSYYVVRCPASY